MKKLFLALPLMLLASVASAYEVDERQLLNQPEGTYYAPRVIHYADVGLVCVVKKGFSSEIGTCFTYQQLGAARLDVLGVTPNADFLLAE